MRRFAPLLTLLALVPMLAACASDKDAVDVTSSNSECSPAKTHFNAGSITPGETVEFELRNTGTEEHEFEVLGPDGQAVGEVSEVQPGKSGEAEMTFTKSGTYTFRCALKDHEQRGMKGTLTVP